MQRVVDRLVDVVDGLLDDETLDAVVRDGWPRPMVEGGFALHRRTWDVHAMAAALERELAALHAVNVPSSITHVWPALPGAGVTPVLLAELLGVGEQTIRPSRRGLHFAQRFAEVSGFGLTDEVASADRYVISGSDATIALLSNRLGADHVVGYGDRQSFAVVVDDGDAARHVAGLATDIALWFGRGCFSARAVLFVGTEHAADEFATALAGELTRREHELAPQIDEAMFADRHQQMGVAQFETRVWPARLGWIERRDRWDGAPRSANVVVLCVCDDPVEVLHLPATHLQGVAWCGPGAERAQPLGVTRVCLPGELQSPPPDWPHDGVSNAAALVGMASGRIGASHLDADL